ncbi:hypothetical protein BUALT_Bualt05G0164000 [Buddleja alternifolia]|uniref:Uncharacterized protein n=1 Tax=Buddleja alternifolia TaxID=168488 RepID=A0AAV6XSZ0_9LAMI|nr:hypothetical protein BUALT_Bualt05G0164000 [Buddleja alternifolia]
MHGGYNMEHGYSDSVEEEEYFHKEDYNSSQGMKPAGGMCAPTTNNYNHNNMHGGYGGGFDKNGVYGGRGFDKDGGYGGGGGFDKNMKQRGHHEGYNSQYFFEELFEEEKDHDDFAGKNEYSAKAGNKLHMSANKYSAAIPKSVPFRYEAGAIHGDGYGAGGHHGVGYRPQAHHGGGYGAGAHHGNGYGPQAHQGCGYGAGGHHGGGYGANHHRPNFCEQKPVWVSKGSMD